MASGLYINFLIVSGVKMLRFLTLFTFTLCFAVTARAEDDQTRYVIIHADDAGMCHSVNMATIDSIENGIVNSSSIMVPCPWLKEYAEYCVNNPEGDYGLHLTLNSEWGTYRWTSVAPPSEVPSLHDPEGYMWGNLGDVAKHGLNNEVEKELRAQIERALAFKIPVSHLDTHMGTVAARQDFLETYVNLGVEYNLPVLFVRFSNQAFPGLNAKKVAELVDRLDSNGLPVLDNLVQIYSENDYDKREQLYLDAFEALKPGVTQVIVHCGYADDELRAVTSSAERRDADHSIFTDPEFIEKIEAMDVKLITWKEFHEMAKAKLQTAKSK
ncbi:hypothetical protein Pla110_44730 [Polystyrenella longa]|uniref:ChbG/HpnK family deacetylase n=1 Tax=Polystyrenella longa TaxID=2528007 RepID=A0A518CU22_9PLAN|nr:polysaccharide deacetylase family protein [Polystyrenella longa]QDU82711.1 hypothetical protein Pla110_44730 [Polystyrenella longa]